MAINRSTINQSMVQVMYLYHLFSVAFMGNTCYDALSIRVAVFLYHLAQNVRTVTKCANERRIKSL